MRNIDCELDRQGVSRIVKVTTEVGPVSTKVSQKTTPSTYNYRPEDDWSWRELRDYVVRQIELRFGPIENRQGFKERAIFESFLSRHPRAIEIARYAFEQQEGVWDRKPVSVFSFCKGSDPFFAGPINARLAQSEVAPW